MAQDRCSICNQSFNSDRDLQEHQRTAHSQNEQREKEPASEQNYGDQNQRREKIA
jgi:hypothetical protein